MKEVSVFDARPCNLGEGPLWHPERQEFFWFDINNYKLMAEGGREWAFDSYVSAAGWVDRSKMMVAGDRALMLFDIDTGTHEDICPLEADNPLTRSNDGRADPFGGFWSHSAIRKQPKFAKWLTFAPWKVSSSKNFPSTWRALPHRENRFGSEESSRRR